MWEACRRVVRVSENELVKRLLSGDRRALARIISRIEGENPEVPGMISELYPYTGEAVTVGFTGPPGVGKSSIIARLVELYREEDKKVGIVSVDPSSPFTKGAILGDRIRLSDHFLDKNVFIRSMGSGGLGAGLKGGGHGDRGHHLHEQGRPPAGQERRLGGALNPPDRARTRPRRPDASHSHDARG